MAQVPIEELLRRCPSVYKLVVVAARRAKELAEGAPKLVEGDFKKAASIALEEIRQGKVVCKASEEEGEREKGKGRAKDKAHATAAKKKKS